MKTPKSIQVLVNGEPLYRIYPHATKWQVFKYNLVVGIRKAVFVGAFTGLVVGTALTYRELVPKVAHAEKEVYIKSEELSPVMQRIAKCESGGQHYKNGQVIFNANTNGTVDIGYLQINSVWNKKATELGLDLTKEKDNKKFGQWLYENRGTEDWYSSKACWQK